MATIRCSRCGSSCDDSTASFGESGLICDPCARGETARDAAQLAQSVRAAESAGGFTPTNATFTGGPPPSGPTLPRSQAHAALEARGATVRRENLTSSINVGPISSDRSGTREVWTLAAPSAVQGSFASEGFFSMVKKLFSKEIQTGDEAFDGAVFIETSTPDATKAWLASADVRAALVEIVKAGETFTVQGNVATGAITWGASDLGSPEVIAQLVASLP